MLKRNMKNKSTSILPAVIILLIVLTGCGKRELVLEQEQSRAEMLSEQDSTPAEESESENMSAAVDETVQKVEESVEMVGEEADSEEADISEELQTGTGNESENSGFNIDVEIDARAYEGESRYLFLAYNKAGYFVEIYWYSSGSGMAMRK